MISSFFQGLNDNHRIVIVRERFTHTKRPSSTYIQYVLWKKRKKKKKKKMDFQRYVKIPR